MKTYLPISRSRRQSGFTYMTVVVTMIVAGVMLAAYLTMISVQNQLVERSQAWNRSVPVLEAGIEEALAHLNHNAGADAAGVFNVNLATDGWQVHASGGWHKTNYVGDDYYNVRITQFVAGNHYPFIEADGYVKQLPAFAMRNTHGLFFAQGGVANVTVTPGYTRRKVVCTTTNVPTFTKGLVARKGIDLNGKNIRTDSFDSGDWAFSDGFGHYTNVMGKWKANGDIASNDNITNTLRAGNASIYGRVATGPAGTVDVGSQGSVGDIAWVNDTTKKGLIKPGWSTDDMNMEFPSVNVPTNLWGALPPLALATNIGGVDYDLVLSAPPGTTNYFRLPSAMNLTGKLYVQGNVRLLVSGSSAISFTGNDTIKIKSGPTNSFHLFADVANVTIGGNGVVNDGIANQFYYFGTDRNTSLSFGGNASFTGVIYAPNADLQLNGGGSSAVADFSGAGIARNIQVNGNFNFHYDEALARIGLYRGYVITSWNEK